MFVFPVTRAGIPATIVSAGTSLVTTACAATIDLLPIVTPFNIVAPAPIQAYPIKRLREIDLLFIVSFVSISIPIT